MSAQPDRRAHTDRPAPGWTRQTANLARDPTLTPDISADLNHTVSRFKLSSSRLKAGCGLTSSLQPTFTRSIGYVHQIVKEQSSL